MRWSWFGEFFNTLPQAIEAWWEFGDPSGLGRGWWGIVILLIWGVLLMAVPFYIARRTYRSREWVSATMGVIGGLAVFWWIFGILPSAWVYFLTSSKEILKGSIVPASFGLNGPLSILGLQILPPGYRLAIADNLYQVLRDLVVIIEHLVAFGLTFWAAKRIQERFPKQLATGEPRAESGGYK